MLGYGQYPPNPEWPEKARVAVQFVINYEEGGENCIFHGDTASETFLSEIIGAVPFQDARHMSMEFTNMEAGQDFGDSIDFSLDSKSL